MKLKNKQTKKYFYQHFNYPLKFRHLEINTINFYQEFKIFFYLRMTHYYSIYSLLHLPLSFFCINAYIGVCNHQTPNAKFKFLDGTRGLTSLINIYFWV